MGNRARDILKIVYINDEEKKILERNMVHYGIRNFSTYARKMLLEPNKKMIIIDSSGFHDVVHELKRIGTNINQMARVANETKEIDDGKINELVLMHQNLIKDMQKDYDSRIKKMEERSYGRD